MNSKNKLLAVLPFVVVMGFSAGLKAEEAFTLNDKWQDRLLTGKALNGITHDNVITAMKTGGWVNRKYNESNYICLQHSNNYCLNKPYTGTQELKVEVKKVFSRGKPIYYLKDTAKFQLKKVRLNFGDGTKDYYQVVQYRKTINPSRYWEYEYDKIHWERTIPTIAKNDGSNQWWWSAFFIKKNIKQKTKITGENIAFGWNNDSTSSKRWKSYYVRVKNKGNLTVELSGLNKDLDLYVQRGSKPRTPRQKYSSEDYNDGNLCIPFKGNTLNETCIFNDLQYGERVYIRVYSPNSYDGLATFNIKAKLEDRPDDRIIGQLTFPFDLGATWYVCQGYNTPNLTHQVNGYNNLYAFDITTSSTAQGRTGCFDSGDGSDSIIEDNREQIISPANGEIVSIDNDIMCIDIDGDLGSIQLGHTNNWRYSENGNYINHNVGGRVIRGETMLGIPQQNTIRSGGFAHIHMALFSDNNCSVNIPFGSVFENAIPFTSDSSLYQWKREELNR